MKLIVGIGNPGKQYEKTRHNIGFMVLDRYANYYNKTFKKQFDGLYTKLQIGKEDVILLKPQLYVNLSGKVVAQFLNFYNIETEDILVISDDLDLTMGKYKLKEKGSTGGHNGLQNIEDNIFTQEYKRLKVGISNDKAINTKDYVLTNLEEKDYDLLNNIDFRNILDDYLTMPFEKLMSKYNHK
jgi:peptidyl-tRNA hydrolase, PTH1 family